MPCLGLMQVGVNSLSGLASKAQKNNFDVIAVPAELMELPAVLEDIMEPGEYTYPELVLSADYWYNKTIIMLPNELDCDSSDTIVRQRSERILERTISWSKYAQMNGHYMVRLKHGNNLNLAHKVAHDIKGCVLVQVPTYNPAVAHAVWRRDVSADDVEQLAEEQDTWRWWNNFRCAADFNPKIKVVLEFHEDERPTDDVIRRWLGEPVEAVIIPASIFIFNIHNFPVLPKDWQHVLVHFVRCHVSIIVASSTEDESLKFYSEYLMNFRKNHGDDHNMKTYEDTLEIPLQPLSDNLDCYTYDIFERDPVKYREYQRAIEAALCDRIRDDEIAKEIAVVMVLGAGRGPLVRAALNASTRTKRKIRVYVIEKNPNAIRTLKAVANKLWHNKDVRIISKDMRQFAPPERADILVSELIGSFGDNELSPECLDSAQTLLKADGISIPNRTTSYINPVMSPKLYNGIASIRPQEMGDRDRHTSGQRSVAECGYVVMMKNVYYIAEPQPLFEFLHPNHDAVINNNRYETRQFTATLDCVLTGIAGYFTAILYKDIALSIVPRTHTAGMGSWFSMYFPLSVPMQIKKNDTVEINFWRCVAKQKVWYEWRVSSPQFTHIHNLGGASYPIFCT